MHRLDKRTDPSLNGVIRPQHQQGCQIKGRDKLNTTFYILYKPSCKQLERHVRVETVYEANHAHLII